MSFVRIKSGAYRTTDVSGRTFQLVEQYKTGAKGGFVTVKSEGHFGSEFDVPSMLIQLPTVFIIAIQQAVKAFVPFERQVMRVFLNALIEKFCGLLIQA